MSGPTLELVTVMCFSRFTNEIVDQFLGLEVAVNEICESMWESSESETPSYGFYNEDHKHIATLRPMKMLGEYDGLVEFSSDQVHIVYRVTYIMEDGSWKRTEKTAVTIHTL